MVLNTKSLTKETTIMPVIAYEDLYVPHRAGYGRVLVARKGQLLSKAQRKLLSDNDVSYAEPTSPASTEPAPKAAGKKAAGSASAEPAQEPVDGDAS